MATARGPSQSHPFGQWAFYVVNADAVTRHGYRSANLAWVERAAGSPVGYADLLVAVNAAYREASAS